jgi:hypothetical protein
MKKIITKYHSDIIIMTVSVCLIIFMVAGLFLLKEFWYKKNDIEIQKLPANYSYNMAI